MLVSCFLLALSPAIAAQHQCLTNISQQWSQEAAAAKPSLHGFCTVTSTSSCALTDGRSCAAPNAVLVQAAHIFRKMVEVVNHCHELGVMHRCEQ